MTIEEALNHDVFAKPVLLRNLNPGGAYADILNTEEVQIETGKVTMTVSVNQNLFLTRLVRHPLFFNIDSQSFE